MERWLFSLVEERIPVVGLFVETLLAEKKSVSGALPTAFAPTTKGTEVMFDIRSLGRKWKSAATPASRECRLTVSVLAAVLLHRGPGRYSVRDRVVIITGGSTGLGLALAARSPAMERRLRCWPAMEEELKRPAADVADFRSPSNGLAM